MPTTDVRGSRHRRWRSRRAHRGLDRPVAACLLVLTASLSSAACAAPPAGRSHDTGSIDFQPPPPVDSAACAERPIGVAILVPIEPADHRAWFDSAGIDLATPAFALLAREELPGLLNAEDVIEALERMAAFWLPGGIEGRPVVGLHVSGTGELVETRLVSSSEVPELDDLALTIARRMRFTPAVLGGCPVESWVGWPVGFRIELLERGGEPSTGL